VVKALVELGADVHALFKYGDTALHCAAGRGHVEVVKALVRLGADVQDRIVISYDSSYEKEYDIKDEEPGRALHSAARAGHVEVVKALSRLGWGPTGER